MNSFADRVLDQLENSDRVEVADTVRISELIRIQEEFQGQLEITAGEIRVVQRNSELEPTSERMS